jgi:hypothetical protein
MEKLFSVKAEEFWQRLILPEEDRAALTDKQWIGGYRWYKSRNILCFEHYRRNAPRCRRAPPWPVAIEPGQDVGAVGSTLQGSLRTLIYLCF